MTSIDLHFCTISHEKRLACKSLLRDEYNQQKRGEMAELVSPSELDKHRILIVNDDGIESPGIKLLEQLAREITDDVWIVAPDEEKSGFSHSISMTIPIRVRNIYDRHYALKGTPTDCALLAIY